MTHEPERISLMGAAPTVLVIDDNDMTRGMIVTLLQRRGYDVIFAINGLEGLEKLAKSQPDLLLLDYKMPDMDGDEVLKRVRANPVTQRLPVLVLTGEQESSVHVQFLDLGADDFLGKPFEPSVLLARVRSLVRMKRLNDEAEAFGNVLASLSKAVEAKDPYTQGHSERVSSIGSTLARAMGLDEQAQVTLERAGLVHDLGKVVVDLSFINKAGKLTDEEWALMKRHPEAGAQILSPLRGALPLLPLVRHHHEKLNGKGYPDGLVEDQITMQMRIISISDVYDALTSSRSYRAAMPHSKAMEILGREVKDGAWDAEVVGALGSLDVGLLEEMSKGEPADRPPSVEG